MYQYNEDPMGSTNDHFVYPAAANPKNMNDFFDIAKLVLTNKITIILFWSVIGVTIFVKYVLPFAFWILTGFLFVSMLLYMMRMNSSSRAQPYEEKLLNEHL